MVKEKKILIYFISFLLGLLTTMLIGITDVFAATYDTQAITWYYRKTSDESTLLNVVKDINTPFYGVSGEYLNGFTTRQDHTFEKDLQYMITYKLIFTYYDGIDSSFRSDTLDRLTSYSWVDSDFKLLNTNVNQTKYDCVETVCRREFTISQQVLTLNATSGIRFGVYTTEAKSIGFYSPSSPPSVEVALSTSITIEDNSSSTIIDQNNQIISGQDGINDNITNSTETITGEIQDMEDAIIDSNNQTQEVIKDQFNSCIENLLLNNPVSLNGKLYNYQINLINGNRYKLGTNENYAVCIHNGDFICLNNFFGFNNYSGGNYSSTHSFIANDSIYLSVSVGKGWGLVDLSNADIFLSLENDYPETLSKIGGKVCSNKLDEQNETIKSGFSSIGNWFKELGDKIGSFFDNLLQGILDGLKELFIPEDGYFENWFNTLKVFFEEKLGFLATPFTIIIDFVNRYLDLNPTEDIIINIPDISVPNFEDHIIVKATTFNWSQLLRSKDSLNTLWQLYLSFIDVFLILNFINLCENKYNRIFGGDTTQYEYYTVEDSYNVDVNTGEIKSQRRNERTTTRKKVN